MLDGNTPTGTSTQDAADAIASLLTDDLLVGDTPEPAVEPVVTTSPDPVVATEPETPEPTTEPPPPLKISLDGEELDEAAIRELKKGSLRQADYTRKTQEIADAKKAFDAEQAQIRADYAAKIAAAESIVQAQAQTRPNFAELVRTLPMQEYLQLKADWDEYDLKVSQLQSERQKAEAAVLADQQAQANAQAEAARDRLFELLPTWKDEAVRTSDWAEMQKVAQSYGVEPSTILGARPELFALMKEVVEYRKLKASTNPPNAVKAAPSGMTVVKPGTRTEPPVETKGKALETATRRAAQTKHVRDAALAIEHLL